MASLPANYLNPANYEQYVQSLAKKHNLKASVFHRSKLESMGCGGIVAVGKGSSIDPRMIILEYEPHTSHDKPVVFVGKGVTFDTGGISLKPSQNMHEMKYDMCGSALAVQAIALAAAMKVPFPVVSLLGLAENMPSSTAIKPGDVYTAYNGSTVEVQNTDAEGRLILGDLLAYASEHYDPLCMLDFATLTGACVVALGNEAAAVLSASDDLYQRIQKASHRSLDRTWRLPHWPVYGEGLKSDVSDLRNIAERGAGTVSAMRFLAHFVDESIAWAHIDIAGTSWRKKPFASQGSGATAWGVRLLAAFMQDLEAEIHAKT